MAREIRTEMLDTLPRRNPHRNARTRRQRGWGNPHGVQDTHQQAEIHTRGARTQPSVRNPHRMLDTTRPEIRTECWTRGRGKKSKRTPPHEEAARGDPLKPLNLLTPTSPLVTTVGGKRETDKKV